MNIQCTSTNGSRCSNERHKFRIGVDDREATEFTSNESEFPDALTNAVIDHVAARRACAGGSGDGRTQPAMTFDHHALMHGRDYAGQNVRGWLAQEKFDGWRALWTGDRLLTRQGERLLAPEWFTDGLPAMPLDGELYLGRGRLTEIQRLAWRRDCPLWREAVLMVFDCPDASGGILERLASITHACERAVIADVFAVGQDIGERLAALLAAGGEGYMLREPSAPYRRGRTSTLLKLKSSLQLQVVGERRRRSGLSATSLAAGISPFTLARNWP